jgi:hypothetical protein
MMPAGGAPMRSKQFLFFGYDPGLPAPCQRRTNVP